MNKASGGDGIPGELFQIPKDDPVKVLQSMSANLENSAVATGLEKVSFHPSAKEGQSQQMFKVPIKLYSFHMLIRLCSKSLKLVSSSST